MTDSEPVQTPVAPSAKAYLDALNRYQLLHGDIGDQAIGDQAKEVLRALHVVLAGGSVRVEIEEQGAVSIVDELERALMAALEETNAICRRGGEVDF